ncbi:MAG: BTAD domain-containing putative transcriptional regulator [Acetobacteraceae bacterium]
MQRTDPIVGGVRTRTNQHLLLSVLGPMAATYADRAVRIVGRKARAVLGYLAVNPGLQETRERLVGLLWSESDEERARGSLRQTLREIRQVFAASGYSGLRTEKLEIEFDKDSLDVDMWAVTAAVEAHQPHPMLFEQQRIAESLLEGLDDLDPAFRVWLLAKRHTLQERLLRALEAGMRREDLDQTARSRLAEATINLDPTHEEACRLVMQARAQAGDVTGALRVYKALWDLLDDEYGMEPSEPTQRLVADIKTGVFETPTHTSPREPRLAADANAATKIALSIGVVDVRGLDPDTPYLIQGFRHHLIGCLVRFREWYVTDQPFEATAERPDVGARYDVSLLAEQGSGAVNLVLTLKELDSDIYVWSDTFELKLDNWFDLQRSIVARIATALKVHLSTERIMRLSEQPDVSLGIYDRWLRCQALILTFSPENWQRAERQFTEIIAAAPNFTAAYCSLAQMHNAIHIVHPGIMREREREQQSLDLARKAAQLDPTDTRAHLCLGWSHALSKQYGSAALHMDTACELNPYDPWTLIAAALFYAFHGGFERAAELSAQALDRAMGPTRTHWAYQVSIQYLRGDYEGALDAADLAMDAIKTLPAWRAAALFRLGRQQEARAEADRFLAGIRASWYGAEPATPETMTRWLLHLYPISHRAGWENLRDGVKGAGLPVGGIRYGEW